MNVSSLWQIVGASLLGLAVQRAVGQGGPPTTEQLGRDPGALRQEAEQQRAQQQRDQQRQSQQQADQLYNDTLRQQQSRAAGDMAQAEAVRRTWQQRPPLAPEKNPLLGRWESLGAGQRKGGAPGLSPEMARANGVGHDRSRSKTAASIPTGSHELTPSLEATTAPWPIGPV